MCIDVMIISGVKDNDQVAFLVNGKSENPKDDLTKLENQLPDKFQAEIVMTANGLGLSFLPAVCWPDNREILCEIGEILGDSVKQIPFTPI